MTSTVGTAILSKTLRDGVTRVELAIAPSAMEGEDPATTLGYELVITWPGGRSQRFQASPHPLQAPAAPGITHAIRVPSATGHWVTMGLTEGEAAQVKAATSAWIQERKDQRRAREDAAKAAARDAAPGAPTFEVGDPYGYLCSAGKATRLPDGRAVTALGFRREYYREDGLSFGAADDSGYVYVTEVREATPAEEAALIKREERAAACKELAAQAAALAQAPDGEVPASTGELSALPGAPAGTGDGFRHLRLDEAGGCLWVVTANGHDGDDWSASNYRSSIARRLPLTPGRAELFARAAAEFGRI